VSAELAVRITVAAAVLGDYQHAVEDAAGGGDRVEWAYQAGRLSSALVGLLEALEGQHVQET
jgi:hypothetical protein